MCHVQIVGHSYRLTANVVLLYVCTTFTNYKKGYNGKIKHKNKQYKIKERN